MLLIVVFYVGVQNQTEMFSSVAEDVSASAGSAVDAMDLGMSAPLQGVLLKLDSNELF